MAPAIIKTVHKQAATRIKLFIILLFEKIIEIYYNQSFLGITHIVLLIELQDGVPQ